MYLAVGANISGDIVQTAEVSVNFLDLLVICLAAGFVAATEEVSPLVVAYDLNVKEFIISAGGHRYRKIEHRGDTFYLRLLESEKDAGSLHLECNSGAAEPRMENQVLLSTAITKRSSLFIDGLKQTCAALKGSGGRRKVEVDPNIRIGFILESSPKDLVQNKKLFVTPGLPGLGFVGEW